MFKPITLKWRSNISLKQYSKFHKCCKLIFCLCAFIFTLECDLLYNIICVSCRKTAVNFLCLSQIQSNLSLKKTTYRHHHISFSWCSACRALSWLHWLPPWRNSTLRDAYCMSKTDLFLFHLNSKCVWSFLSHICHVASSAVAGYFMFCYHVFLSCAYLSLCLLCSYIDSPRSMPGYNPGVGRGGRPLPSPRSEQPPVPSSRKMGTYHTVFCLMSLIMSLKLFAIEHQLD